MVHIPKPEFSEKRKTDALCPECGKEIQVADRQEHLNDRCYKHRQVLMMKCECGYKGVQNFNYHIAGPVLCNGKKVDNEQIKNGDVLNPCPDCGTNLEIEDNSKCDKIIQDSGFMRFHMKCDCGFRGQQDFTMATFGKLQKYHR